MTEMLHPDNDGTQHAPVIFAIGAMIAVVGAVILPAGPFVGGGIAAVGAAISAIGVSLWRKGKRVVVEIASYDGKKLRGTVSGPMVATAHSIQVNVKTVAAKVFADMKVEDPFEDAGPRLMETGRTEKTLGTDHAAFNAPISDVVRFQLDVTPLSNDLTASDYVELLVTVDPKDGSERWAATYRLPRP